MPAASSSPAAAPDTPAELHRADWLAIGRRTVAAAGKDNAGIIAAGVSFYLFLALVPLLAAIVLTYGLVVAPETVARHVGGLFRILPPEPARLVAEQLVSVAQGSGGKQGLGLAIAIGLAFWSARNAAGAVVTALNIAYGTTEKRGFVRTTLHSLGITAGAVAMGGLVAGVTALLARLERILPDLGGLGKAGVALLSYALLAGIAAAAAATLYRYGPSREKARWTWLTPGSIFFAAVWLLLTLGFGFYVRNFANYGATYGSLSAPIVLLTWFYLSAYVLIVGAELNSEVERQAETSEAAEPNPAAPLPAPVAPAPAIPAPRPTSTVVLLRAGAGMVVAGSLLTRMFRR